MSEPLLEYMEVYQALDWLGNLPDGVVFAYLGPNPRYGGYSCVLHVGKRPWWQLGGPRHIIDGQDDETVLGAVLRARQHLERGVYHE